ncbi:DUF3072 domain-containing protein [Salipiger marinus]|jgi:hypothetical protein|uniref:DUF3072 domain-containing protein n=1 Tax=Salipiger marinus TaxID=555512 RepID=A0A1G8ISW8_9RHOB|nr:MULTISPECIES: DUF3072 domain-containing protein [Salipiger]MCD1618260.1 DUF3072 domain-containing protein [Salipiger manganoxidans]MEB3418143.1 DUF3072 domain-containing protein [Salipiger manganoxidans]SDI21807.1 Protein of unknown function [Salipiger marinus]HBT00009.1 DUF3072 domain-containing protein [Citreicella sp.]|tara:strand:+ start:392 stop:592 length:201 start_codon:yes stop_codon:yes gene_type:complete
MSTQSEDPAIDAAMDVPPDPREPMTEVQTVRLRELSEQTGEPFTEELTEWQAEQRIAELEGRIVPV